MPVHKESIKTSESQFHHCSLHKNLTYPSRLSLFHSLAQSNYLWQRLNLSVLCCEGSTLFNPFRGRSLCERMLCKQRGPLM